VVECRLLSKTQDQKDVVMPRIRLASKKLGKFLPPYRWRFGQLGGFSATARSAERQVASKIFTRVSPWGAPKKLDQCSLIKLVSPKSETAGQSRTRWFLAATRTRSGSGELASLASVHKCLRIRDLCKELAFGSQRASCNSFAFSVLCRKFLE
jgi:hypothetical protein